MVAINFSKFVDKVADGTKRQTIRASDRGGCKAPALYRDADKGLSQVG